jgi:hypothetical protein
MKRRGGSESVPHEFILKGRSNTTGLSREFTVNNENKLHLKKLTE